MGFIKLGKKCKMDGVIKAMTVAKDRFEVNAPVAIKAENGGTYLFEVLDNGMANMVFCQEDEKGFVQTSKRFKVDFLAVQKAFDSRDKKKPSLFNRARYRLGGLFMSRAAKDEVELYHKNRDILTSGALVEAKQSCLENIAAGKEAEITTSGNNDPDTVYWVNSLIEEREYIRTNFVPKYRPVDLESKVAEAPKEDKTMKNLAENRRRRLLYQWEKGKVLEEFPPLTSQDIEAEGKSKKIKDIFEKSVVAQMDIAGRINNYKRDQVQKDISNQIGDIAVASCLQNLIYEQNYGSKKPAHAQIEFIATYAEKISKRVGEIAEARGMTTEDLFVLLETYDGRIKLMVMIEPVVQQVQEEVRQNEEMWKAKLAAQASAKEKAQTVEAPDTSEPEAQEAFQEADNLEEIQEEKISDPFGFKEKGVELSENEQRFLDNMEEAEAELQNAIAVAEKNGEDVIVKFGVKSNILISNFLAEVINRDITEPSEETASIRKFFSDPLNVQMMEVEIENSLRGYSAVVDCNAILNNESVLRTQITRAMKLVTRARENVLAGKEPENLLEETFMFDIAIAQGVEMREEWKRNLMAASGKEEPEHLVFDASILDGIEATEEMELNSKQVIDEVEAAKPLEEIDPEKSNGGLGL